MALIRPVAILAFFGSYLGIAALLYVAALARQSPNAPSILAIPLIGVALTTVPASVGFAIGVFFWGRAFSMWRCITCGILVAVGVAAISSPIVNFFPASTQEFAANVAFTAVFLISACLPRFAKSSARIKGEEDATLV